METTKSLDIINQMLLESKKSLHRNSFYFILWGILLVPAGIFDYIMHGQHNAWIAWPAIGIIGGIVSGVYGAREDKRSGVETMGDRITLYTWGSFGFGLIFSLAFSFFLKISPYPMILMLSGIATFISGGISKFKPFIWGAVALEIGAVICAFFLHFSYHGIIFAIAILLGYLIPGYLLRKEENGQA